MWLEKWFVRLKDEFIVFVLTIKGLILNTLTMLIFCFWLVITGQEQKWILKHKKLAEQDRNNANDQMPNEFIQGVALTVCTFFQC